MEKIDLSTNARSIEDAYLRVVRNQDINYVVYTVNKSSVVDVETTGSGDLNDFVEHFTDGHVQFGLARVSAPGSDVFKNLLLGWCPDNAPAKARLSFASNFADISNILKGFHVQITARDQDDLDVDEFLSRVSAASGARYSIQSTSASAKPTTVKPTRVIPPPQKIEKPIEPKPIVPKPAAKPNVSAKPSFIPKSTGMPINVSNDSPIIKPKPPVTSKPVVKSENEDEWGGEKEIEERDFDKKPLEDVPSAYKPTKVNIDELRKGKSDTISSQPKPNNLNEEKKEEEAPKSLSDRMSAYKSNEAPSDGRLTSLPKPKINNSVASRYASGSSGPSFGSKPSFIKPVENKTDKLVTDNRDFASENGKTPAQIWAEKRGKYKTVPQSDESASTPEPTSENELTEKFSKVAVEESVPEPEPEVEEEEEEEETPEIKSEPTIIKPSAFPPPPARSLPPKEEPVAEPEPEVEEEEEVASSTPVPTLPTRSEPALATTKKNSAVAEYTYEKDEDNEIGFEEGDLIIEIEFVDEDWWSGKHSKSGEVGLFPSSYVSLKEESEVKESTPAPALPSRSEPEPEPEPVKSDKPSATAEYDYEKDEENEIGFSEGDVITEIEFVDDDWWSGKHSTSGETGLFPANYVKLNN